MPLQRRTILPAMRRTQRTWPYVLAFAVFVTACSGGDDPPGGVDSSGDGVDVADDVAVDVQQPSGDRPEFCVELEAAVAAMLGNFSSAGDSGVDQLMMLITNTSEANRMMFRLAEVAPEEIRTDMEIARDAWTEALDSTAAGVSDPVGALATMLVSVLKSSTSFARVDSWAATNCGQIVFEGQSMPPCPGLPAGGPQFVFPRVFDPHTPARGLLDAVDQIADVVPGTQEFAESLRTSAGQLSPSAVSARELVGRAGWVDRVSVRSSLFGLSDAVSQWCGRAGFDLSEFDMMVPLANVDGTISGVDDLWGECELFELTDGRKGMFECGDRLVSYEFDTAVAYSAAIPVDRLEEFSVEIAEDLVVWKFERTTPARGLDPELVEVGIATLDMRTGDIDEFMITNPDGTKPFNTYIFVATRDRVVFSVQFVGVHVLNLDDGSLTTFPASSGFARNGEGELYAGGWLYLEFGDEQALLNVNTFERQPVQTTAGNITDTLANRFRAVCRERFVGLRPFQLGTVGPAGVSFGPAVDLGNFSSGQPTGVRADVAVVPRQSAIEGVDAAGNILWSLPKSVAESWTTIGGWVLIRNTSGEWVPVDPYRGVEATLPGSVATFVDVVADELPYWSFTKYHFDNVTGDLSAVASDTFVSAPAADVCPTGPTSPPPAASTPADAPDSQVDVPDYSEAFIKSVYPTWVTFSGGVAQDCGVAVLPAARVGGFPADGSDSLIYLYEDPAEAREALDAFVALLRAAADGPVDCVVVGGGLGDQHTAPSSAVPEGSRWRTQWTYLYLGDAYTRDRIARLCGAAVIWEDADMPGSTDLLGCP